MLNERLAPGALPPLQPGGIETDGTGPDQTRPYDLRLRPMDFSGISRRQDRWVHEQIADVIEGAIRTGELGPREMLPSEQEIIYQSGASRWSVRRAMALLRERGLIYTRAHLGSFASPPGEPPQAR